MDTLPWPDEQSGPAGIPREASFEKVHEDLGESGEDLSLVGMRM